MELLEGMPRYDNEEDGEDEEEKDKDEKDTEEKDDEEEDEEEDYNISRRMSRL